jgi:hypothetical protein
MKRKKLVLKKGVCDHDHVSFIDLIMFKQREYKLKKYVCKSI